MKVTVSVNRELIAFYRSLGKDIVVKEADKKYGSGFYNRLSSDLRDLLPDTTGLASFNLRYMVKFYCMYSILLQVVGNLTEEDLFSVHRGHHRLIIDCCKGDSSKAFFFIRKTIENNWSRAVLDNFLDTDLYDRQGKAISNKICGRHIKGADWNI